MLFYCLCIIVGALLGVFPSRGAQIEGKVVIQHTLTKPRVTAPATSYQRGMSVQLALRPGEEDPLAFERRHVAVYLEGALPASPISIEMEQKDRQFSPDLVVVPAGSTVSFPNMDLIFHNVFSLSKPKTFDLGNYAKGQTRTVTFAKPGLVYVYCRLHSNMSATIVVTPNRWNSKVDAAGKFSFTDVPPGKYTIVAWHKAAGFFRQQVDLTEGQTTAVEFLLPLDASGSVALARR